MILPESASDRKSPTTILQAPPEYHSHEFTPSTSRESTLKDPLFGAHSVTQEALGSSAFVTENGRIDIELDLKRLPELPQVIPTTSVDLDHFDPYTKQVPRMNIVIMIAGSHDDLQPCIALGKRIQIDGHRVRIATHTTFRALVMDSDLEFFDIGGSSNDLGSAMIPGIESPLKTGDMKQKKKMLSEMMHGCWAACYAPCHESQKAFFADAIISNPSALAHVHCAEALGIPLVMTSTTPWTPTSSFAHPLVNVKHSNVEPHLTNYLSYHLTELLAWQVLGDSVNDFRTKTLGLEPLSITSGPGILDTLRVPWTYFISSALILKPVDWLPEIDIAGVCSNDWISDYIPPSDLAEFLAGGPPPIYVGFGSVVVDDPVAMTNTIIEATKQAGVRALVSLGWGPLEEIPIPAHLFILKNVPRDWLLDEGRVAAVIHHGDAGTTAAGLSKGLPTVVVPLSGDQIFWGNMIEKAGAGPAPLSPENLTIESLATAIVSATTPSARSAARDLANKIYKEDGVNRGALSFYHHMPLDDIRCDLDPSRAAVWWSKKYCLRLSCFAAQALSERGQFDIDSLKLFATHDAYNQVQANTPIANTAFRYLNDYSPAMGEIFSTSTAPGLTAIPDTAVKIIHGANEGFQNVPELYGARTRKAKKVTGISSGLKEGGKALAYGMYDGLVGLVKEPIRGGMEEGPLGAIKGSARGLANLGVRPVSGMAALVAHPLHGAWESLKSDTSRKNAKHRKAIRIQQGKDEVAASTPEERLAIMKAFSNSISTLEQRRQLYKGSKDSKGKGRAVDFDRPGMSRGSGSYSPSSTSYTESVRGVDTGSRWSFAQSVNLNEDTNPQNVQAATSTPPRYSCPPAYSPSNDIRH